MEIEAKFQVPDQEVFDHLLQAPALAGYSLGPASLAELHDRYLDTPGGAFRAAGLTCRLRQQGDRTLATLKDLSGADGAIHRRAEYEVELGRPLPPADWPPSAARDMALPLCGSEPLVVLFDLYQTRYVRLLSDGDRRVAELNLSRVTVQQGDDISPAELQAFAEASLDTYLELEVELLPDGGEEDLARLSLELEGEWGLAAESLSKFYRALDSVAAGAAAETEPETIPHLTAQERAIVERLSRERAVLSRRARMLLAWDDGASLAEMLERSGLSPRRGRYWRWAFRERRLGIFPKKALRSATAPEEAPRGKRRARQARAETPASITVGPEKVTGAEPREGLDLLKRPGMEPDDPTSEAGRKVLRFQFRRMLQNEAATRGGDDIEALHDMRVATRRMRAAFRVFADYLEPKAVAPLMKGLRRTGWALGDVRDLDVFRDKVRAYRASLPGPQQGSLDGFLAELQARREAARQRLLAYLDSGRYAGLVERFATFTETPGLGSVSFAPDGGEPRPYRVRHVAPMALYERLADVRAHDEWVTRPDVPLARLHALRIATKRLRYTLEFFQEVLGPDTKALIKDTVAVQDYLGLVQDGVVASGILRDFLVWGTWGPEVEGKRLRGDVVPVIAPGVAIYLAVRQSEIQQLVAEFPSVWGGITGTEFSRGLGAAVGVL